MKTYGFFAASKWEASNPRALSAPRGLRASSGSRRRMGGGLLPRVLTGKTLSKAKRTSRPAGR